MDGGSWGLGFEVQGAVDREGLIKFRDDTRQGDPFDLS
jgi:hypothetical protein